MSEFNIKNYIETTTKNRITVEFISCQSKAKFYEICFTENISENIILKLDKDIFSKANSKIAQSLISLCQSNSQIQGLAEKIIASFIKQHSRPSNKPLGITKNKIINIYKTTAKQNKNDKNNYSNFSGNIPSSNKYFTSFADIDPGLLSLAIDEIISENNAPHSIKEIIMEALIVEENET